MNEKLVFYSWQEQKISSLFGSVQCSSLAYPAFCSVDTRAAFPKVKWWPCDADHSPPSSAEVKNEWSYTSIHPHAFMVCSGKTLLEVSQGKLALR
jgi:hypothetical protein